MRLINEQDVFDIIDDLRDRMTVEGYCAMVERVKALPSATCGNLEKPEIPQHSEGEAADCNLDCISRQMLLEYIHGEPVGKLLCDKYNLDGLIEQFPSAQPETHDKRTETHACDLISRQVVINTVRTIILGFFSDEDGVTTDTEKTLLSVNKAVCNGVRELPYAQQDCTECEEYDHERHYCPKFCDVIRKTADKLQVEASCKLPDRKTGRWIIRDNPGTGWYRITCSECGEDVTATAPCIGFFPNAKVNWDYCPNCGARMEVDDATD